MEINITKQEGLIIVNLAGDLLGEQHGTQILGSLSGELDGEFSKLVVVASDLRYVNSTGIGVLITLMTRVKNLGKELVLVSPSDQIRKLFALTKLDAVFNIKNSIDEV